MKQALQQVFTSRSRWLLQILGLNLFLSQLATVYKKGIARNEDWRYTG
jgi:hypothetical protein